ncbi:hypothetical protein OGATHE_006139 [Ogataea polymorpha]|uniref:Uncharacterized protein n=1 Tax=Ogataea polymorpha TaxID=460523 RepID=A0A9P8SYX2_9ASCO|nr:hypothetical protein OGATHE_006139 [Ogataea polymorpha]
MSVSTEMQLNERSVACLSIFCNAGAAIGASVTKNPSSVAMLGQIMPAPLASPAKEYVTPSSSNLLETSLGNVSVVIMPRAHDSQCSCDEPSCGPTSSVMPLVILSICNRWPITPVDITRADREPTPSSRPTVSTIV